MFMQLANPQNVATAVTGSVTVRFNLQHTDV